MNAMQIIGTDFLYKGKLHTVKNVESCGVIAKLKDVQNSPLKLILPISMYNEITGNNITAPEPITITANEYKERDIIRKAEMVRYNNGKNGKETIDRYIADGYNKIITIPQGAVNKYYLDNEKTGLQLHISGVLRYYAEIVLATLK